MIEKWRVIDESGATHEVDVTSDGSAHPLWTTRATYRGIEQKTFPTTTARRSVLRWAVGERRSTRRDPRAGATVTHNALVVAAPDRCGGRRARRPQFARTGL